MLKVFVLCAVALTVSSFPMNDHAREKRTVMIPPHVLETLLPVLQKLLPEEKLMMLQGLLVKAMLVPDPMGDAGGASAAGEHSLVETLDEPSGDKFLSGGGLARIEESYSGIFRI